MSNKLEVGRILEEDLEEILKTSTTKEEMLRRLKEKSVPVEDFTESLLSSKDSRVMKIKDEMFDDAIAAARANPRYFFNRTKDSLLKLFRDKFEKRCDEIFAFVEGVLTLDGKPADIRFEEKEFNIDLFHLFDMFHSFCGECLFVTPGITLVDADLDDLLPERVEIVWLMKPFAFLPAHQEIIQNIRALRPNVKIITTNIDLKGFKKVALHARS